MKQEEHGTRTGRGWLERLVRSVRVVVRDGRMMRVEAPSGEPEYAATGAYLCRVPPIIEAVAPDHGESNLTCSPRRRPPRENQTAAESDLATLFVRRRCEHTGAGDWRP
jgi:hypothetical protein